MPFNLRPYQRQALDALDAYWAGGGGNPLLVLATGTGKSLLIAWLIRDLREQYPDFRVLVVTHVQELIEQNLEHMLALWPDAPVGVNCAALDRRDCDPQIIFASIQSVFRNPKQLGQRHLVIVDEAHLIPHIGDGMYRSLIQELRNIESDMRVCGLTATPFRDTGRLDEGEGKIFDDIVFSYDIGDGIRDGWLAPLASKATRTKIDVSNVGRRGGEFIESELQAAADIEAIVDGACKEIIAWGAGRRSWLVFCTGVTHAEHVRDKLREHGITVEMVLGETPQDERENIIAQFKAGTIRCATSVGVLTTGFNVPHVDLIAMLRPTLSTGLYVQMIGRGSRKARNKTDCLVLDFAGNVRRHGPVDCISLDSIKANGSTKPDEQKCRICPECDELNAINAKTCVACGYEWPKPKSEPKHSVQADAVPVLGGQPTWVAVDRVSFHVHHKRTDPLAPPSMRVEYLCGLSSFQEYMAFEREGWARHFAHEWWSAMGGLEPAPELVSDAIARSGEIGQVTDIAIHRDGKWWRVVERRQQNGDEVDRHYKLWPFGSRRTTPTMQPEPFNDEVPY